MPSAHSNPYGEARFASEQELRGAGLLICAGIEFGLFGNSPLFHSNRAGIKVTGGAGCGKTSQLALPMLLGSDASFVLLDTKNAEITSVVEAHCAVTHTPLYTIDPFGLSGLPRLRVSLLSHLKPSSAMLVPDSQRFWISLLPDSGGDNIFFEQTGRRFGDAITRHDVHLNGGTSLLSLFDLISMMRGSEQAWQDWTELSVSHSPPDVVATLCEMSDMRADAPKTFESVMAGITNALSFMASPAAQ